MDFRCVNPKCRKLLFRGEIDSGTVEIICHRCGHILKVGTQDKKKKVSLVKR